MLVGLLLVLLLAAATVISGAYAWIDENRMMTDAYVFIVTLCNLCRPFSQCLTEYSATMSMLFADPAAAS